LPAAVARAPAAADVIHEGDVGEKVGRVPACRSMIDRDLDDDNLVVESLKCTRSASTSASALPIGRFDIHGVLPRGGQSLPQRTTLKPGKKRRKFREFFFENQHPQAGNPQAGIPRCGRRSRASSGRWTIRPVRCERPGLFVYHADMCGRYVIKTLTQAILTPLRRFCPRMPERFSALQTSRSSPARACRAHRRRWTPAS